MSFGRAVVVGAEHLVERHERVSIVALEIPMVELVEVVARQERCSVLFNAAEPDTFEPRVGEDR